MAARVSEDAKKFVVLLASRLKKDNIQINDDAESYLRTAISSLPETPLKSALQKQHNAYLKTFISLIGIKSTKEKNKVDDQTETAKIFNLFGKHGLDRAICKLLHQDIDDTCLRSCYPLIQDSEKLLSVLKADETDTDKCMAMTSGHNTAKSVCESLDFIVRIFNVFIKLLTRSYLEYIFRRMSEKCEQYLQEPVHKKRASALKDCIFKTVVMMHMRWQSVDRAEGYVSTKRQTYEDYMAALFSLYIDLVLVCMTSSEEEVHQSNKHLASVVLLVLGRSPVHLMDTCLQLSNLNGDNINHLTPFLRCVLERNKGNLTHTDYIKFVCLAHMVLQIGSTPEPGTCIALNEVVKSQVPPPKFVSWLNQRNRSLVEKLCLSRKMTSSHVTKHLIDKMSEEDKEHLLDDTLTLYLRYPYALLTIPLRSIYDTLTLYLRYPYALLTIPLRSTYDTLTLYLRYPYALLTIPLRSSYDTLTLYLRYPYALLTIPLRSTYDTLTLYLRYPYALLTIPLRSIYDTLTLYLRYPYALLTIPLRSTYDTLTLYLRYPYALLTIPLRSTYDTLTLYLRYPYALLTIPLRSTYDTLTLYLRYPYALLTIPLRSTYDTLTLYLRYPYALLTIPLRSTYDTLTLYLRYPYALLTIPLRSTYDTLTLYLRYPYALLTIPLRSTNDTLTLNLRYPYALLTIPLRSTYGTLQLYLRYPYALLTVPLRSTYDTLTLYLRYPYPLLTIPLRSTNDTLTLNL
ncbi:predicted protein [Nematostella vectensis]|uniref:Uncharacterized protein n=1 Tax=Nematostella vectensis TaxID=45351 RepID=A7RVC3_NEMVE|nr:predicted protein [Nematostella vectensis]|eukprot:XP_001636610.1 predicted protein [Nematostella vectensis]